MYSLKEQICMWIYIEPVSSINGDVNSNHFHLNHQLSKVSQMLWKCNFQRFTHIFKTFFAELRYKMQKTKYREPWHPQHHLCRMRRKKMRLMTNSDWILLNTLKPFFRCLIERWKHYFLFVCWHSIENDLKCRNISEKMNGPDLTIETWF